MFGSPRRSKLMSLLRRYGRADAEFQKRAAEIGFSDHVERGRKAAPKAGEKAAIASPFLFRGLGWAAGRPRVSLLASGLVLSAVFPGRSGGGPAYRATNVR